MPGIKCELFCCSNLEHLQEVYTGFRLLEKQGKLRLSYHIYKDRPTSLPEHSSAELFVRLNDSRLLLFDLLDFGDIREECLEQVDFCFKRSFSSRIIGHQLAYKRVF